MKRSRILFTLSGFLACALSAVRAVGAEGSGIAAVAKQFSEDRHQVVSRLSVELGIRIPSGTGEFFAAAEVGDWPVLSNKYQGFRASGVPRPEFLNPLWTPVLETFGFHSVVQKWQNNTDLLEEFAKPILESMPEGSVYFGGTDPGRFLVTALNATRFDSKVFVITQNQLVDSTYVRYLGAVHGEELWLPGKKGMQAALDEYVRKAQSGNNPGDVGIRIVGGRPQVFGRVGVMGVNGILCRMVFEHNQDDHEFFVEESGVIDWMYPHLEPWGPVMKLNKEPVSTLSDEVVQRDIRFWNEQLEALASDPEFSRVPGARNAFAKLRCSGAGVYSFHGQYESAEAAFEQAHKLCPYSVEVHLRYARMQDDRGKLDRALKVMERLLEQDPAILAKHNGPDAWFSIDDARKYLVELRRKKDAGSDRE